MVITTQEDRQIIIKREGSMKEEEKRTSFRAKPSKTKRIIKFKRREVDSLMDLETTISKSPREDLSKTR